MPDLIGAFSLLGFEAHPIGDGPADADAEAANSRELLRAVAVSGFAMMNIMLLSVSVWSGATGATRDLFHWLSAMIALPTVAYAGRPFFRSAWRVLRHRRTNMDVPISIGVLITTALSLHETIISGPHAYFDGVVMLLFFLLCGRWLDSVMRDRARGGVTALLRNMGSGAMVVGDRGASRWVDATALEPGMVMLVAAGERLAADGVVTGGAGGF
ncbi:MAG TPA: nitrogen fixation protein FixI, partial [Sphingopyxis sp.]|nr:nitrogen fixation protein FixI [Sphingopyxis sp.]